MPRRTTPSSRRRVAGTTTIRVTGVLSQGAQLVDCDEVITIPADKIEPGEIVFRVADNLVSVGLAARDVLIVEQRENGRAATGEFVVAALEGRAFVGRWWTKHGSRALLDNESRTIVEGPELAVLGAVTLIARYESS